MAYLLLVDDDEDFAEAAAAVMRASGHEVRIELDTGSALKSIKRRPPDLLVLDVMFPEDSRAGFRLARRIRSEHAELTDTPILMLTAVNPDAPMGFPAREPDQGPLPISDYLEKPVDLDNLVGRVSIALAGRT